MHYTHPNSHISHCPYINPSANANTDNQADRHTYRWANTYANRSRYADTNSAPDSYAYGATDGHTNERADSDTNHASDSNANRSPHRDTASHADINATPHANTDVFTAAASGDSGLYLLQRGQNV